MPSSMPNITPAQIVGMIAAVVTQLVGIGLIDSMTEKKIVGIAGIVVPALLFLADAIIRHGRSRALAPPPVAASPPPSGTTQP